MRTSEYYGDGTLEQHYLVQAAYQSINMSKVAQGGIQVVDIFKRFHDVNEVITEVESFLAS